MFLVRGFLTGSDTGWQVKARSRLFAVGGVRQDRTGPRTLLLWPDDDNGDMAKVVPRPPSVT